MKLPMSRTHWKRIVELGTLCALALSLVGSVLAAPASPRAADKFGWKFEYDDADRVTRVTDPAGRDTRLQYSFDGAKRLRKMIRVRADEPSVAREFDESGLLQSMTDGAGTVSYGYDERGRLNRVQRQGTAAVAYAYDTQDRVTRLQVGDFYRVEYSYDFLGRLASMKTPAGDIQYEYLTGQGKVVRTLPNGVKTIWEYEPNGRLRQISHADSRNAVLAQYTYQYRPDGLIEKIGEISGGQQAIKSYEYDVVGRLVKASGPSGQHAYEYDAFGNRLKATASGKPAQSYTYDWAGRLKTVDGAPTEHDASGNLTSLTLGGATFRYRHNQDGQLAEVLDGKVSYRYDGDGNMIRRSAGGVDTNFVPDPLAAIWRPLVMTGKGGQRTLLVWEGATTLMVIRDGRAEFLLHDHLGSVRVVADAQGKLVQRIDYDPFGSPADPALAKDFAPKFTGLFWDPLATTYSTFARSYSPLLGRFLQIDPKLRAPIGSPGDVSVYSYCADDPVDLVDLDGADPRKVVERLDVIEAMVAAAFREAAEATKNQNKPDTGGQLATRAWQIAEQWRYKQTPYPEKYALQGKTPSPQEFRTAENRLYATQYVATGKTNAMPALRVFDTDPGKPALDMMNRVMIPSWRGIHWLGETLHVGPQVILRGDWQDQGNWEPQSPISREQQRIGADAGLRLHEAELAVSGYVKGIGNGTAAKPSSPSTLATRTEQPEHRDGRREKPLLDRRSDLIGGGSPPPPGGGGGGGSPPGGGSGAGPGFKSTPLSPSNVGGVYLGGSGQTLAGAGLFDGITLDRNNNLVLIGKSGAEIKLPPLRLDDMVTIFRSVYLHGEGPSVTIDPSPENPEGSAMIIRHGKATENTYVGWVLYQADRLMKGYTLGIDNVTAKDLVTTVPGHADVLKTIFFGGESPDKLRKEGHWQRFWIVPAESRRFVAPKKELTLFDVPLEVKTQSMKWEKGKLVDDSQGKSSPGALAFKNWFTANYDAIARERFLTPPRESGITQPVPVFTELRRIALMTAIAEKLRDQGVPMPFWMRDYEVRPVPFEKITPGLLVTRSETRSNERLTARIYGGVNLSVADKDARTYTSGSDVAKTPSKDAVSVRQNLALAGALEEAVRPLAATSEPVKVRTFAHAGTNYQAAALPGAETQALAPARLEETDLVVPVPGREPIRLVRSYNSFFDPAGPWGKGWALDLPRLDEVRVPGNRTDKGVEFRTAYELVTPLNSVYARFARVESVAALNGSRLQVPDQPGDFLGLADGKPEFLTGQTRQLIRKNGGSWHFSKSGELVAIEQSGSRAVYERDEKGRVSRIVGLAGKRPVATIDLRYDASGRIERATAKGGQREASVRYEYDANGKLAGVVSDSGRLGYRYTGSLLTEVTGKPAGGDAKKTAETLLRRFEYGPRGRLTAEIGADGTKTDYRVSSDANGSAVTATSGGKAARSDVVRYDPALRPVQAQYADGTQASWSYPQGGGLVMDLTPADGRKIRLTEAADQRSRSVQLAPDRKIETQYDAAGRLTSLIDNGQPVLRQKWAPDGRLLVASNPTSAANFEYSPDGLVSRVLLAPPGESGTFKVWQATRLDEAGRPIEVTDYRGLQTSMDYTGSGELRAATVKRDGKNYGFQIDRDPAGRVREVKSSWGASQYAYDPAGLLTKVDVESMGQKSSAEWKSGLLQKVRQFDGGELSLKYYDDKKRAGLPKEIVDPNRLALAYDYDASNRLSQVAVGSNYRLLLDYDSKGRLASWNYAAAKH